VAKEFVAYTALGDYQPGDVVNPGNWSEEEWAYMVEHEVVVPKNSPNDPNVLKENQTRIASGMLGEGVQNAEENIKAAKRAEALEAHREASGEDAPRGTEGPVNETERAKMGAEAYKASKSTEDGQETGSTAPGATTSSTPAKPATKPEATKPAPKKE
jgi:hypothetical protein